MHASAELLVAADHGRVSGEIGRWLVHDIRGPLQGVTLTLALLAEPDAPPFDDSLREALTTASSELSGIVTLLDRLLRLPKPDAESGPVLAGDVLRIAARLFARGRAKVDLSWPADATLAALPPVVAAADNLLHVILSLLLRAVAAAGPGGRVEITVAPAPGAVEISFSAFTPGAAAAGFDPAGELAVAASRALLEPLGGSVAAGSDGSRTTLTARLLEFGRSP